MNIRQIYWRPGEGGAIEADPFQYCPLCGSPLSPQTLNHQLRKICSDCGYVHFRNPLPTVSLLIVSENKVLLGKRLGDSESEAWATPSGYIEIDEDFLTTAVREAKEETGLDVRIVSILNVTDSFFPPDQHYLNVYLLAHVTGGRLQSGDDMGQLCWFSLSEALPEMVFQEDIDLIYRFRQVGSTELPVEPVRSLGGSTASTMP